MAVMDFLPTDHKWEGSVAGLHTSTPIEHGCTCLRLNIGSNVGSKSKVGKSKKIITDSFLCQIKC